jgi:asparagine synthase (glutamine-hydrolysing)
MCGIIGFNFLSKNENIFNATKHRGPDNTSKLELGNFTLGHNRLNIVDHNDLSNQPMTSHCGRYTLVFNGEIYNHKDLKTKLKNKYKFNTESDTEVILYSYIEYGDKCVDSFRGMFSFAIYDKKKNRLFCARDRIGIKPFLYYFKDGRFIFGSEINVILECLNKETPEVNNEAIFQYIKYLYIPYPGTIFKDIMKLPPGHTLVFNDNDVEVNKYWDIEDYVGKNYSMSEGQILSELDKLFDESVRMRMVADVELGSFLSGGIDSSLILYYMQKNSTKKINTYTLGFKGAKKHDETSDAKIVSDAFCTNHKEIIIDPKVAELLPKMVNHFGEPFASPTGMLIYELTKEAKKISTVALAGDGGDEIFGGYPKYKAVMVAHNLRIVPRFIWRVMANIVKNIPESEKGGNVVRRVKKFIFSLGKTPAQMYDNWSSYISDSDMRCLFKEEVLYEKNVEKLWIKQKSGNGLIKSSIVDLKTYLPNDMLYYGDVMSMANSFEVRYPLIDHKIVEFMTSINPKYRIRKGKTKYLMKALLKNKVPDSIINKKKLGLNPPISIWLKNDLSNYINDYLSKKSVDKRGLFNYKYVEQIIKEFKVNKKDRALNIWALIVLEEWFRQYIDIDD